MEVNKHERRRERIADEVRTIVKDAPPEQEKRQGYVIECCLMLEASGWDQADYREVEEKVRSRLNLPQW